MLAIRLLWLLAAPAAAQLLNLPELPLVGPVLGGGESTEAVPAPTSDPAATPSEPAETPLEPATSEVVEEPAVTVAPAPDTATEAPTVAPIPESTPAEPATIVVPSVDPVPTENTVPAPVIEQPTIAPAPVVIPTLAPQEPAPSVVTQQPIQVPTFAAPAPQNTVPEAPATQAPVTAAPVETTAAAVPVQQQPATSPGVIAIPTLAPAAPAVANPGTAGTNPGTVANPGTAANVGGTGVTFFNAPSAATQAVSATPPVTTLVTSAGNTFLSIFIPPSAVAAVVSGQPSFAPDGTFINPAGSNPNAGGPGTASDVDDTATIGSGNTAPGNTDSAAQDSGMSQGTKIGIAVAGAAGGVAVLVAIIYLFWKRRMGAARKRLSGASEAGTLPGLQEKQKMDWETEHSRVSFDFGFGGRRPASGGEETATTKKRESVPIEMRAELEGDTLPLHHSPPHTGTPLVGGGNPLSGFFGRR